MTSVSTLAQSQMQLENLQKLLQESGTLQTQAASGKKSQTFAGLGADALFSEKARTSLDSLTSYDNNITGGQTRLNIMTTSITQIQQQAKSVVDAMGAQVQNGNFDMSALNSIASNALTFVQNLLNEQDGSQYVFAGADTNTQPLNDTGTLDTYVQTNIKDWVSGNISTDQLIASYTDRSQMSDTVMGYSATLASGQAKNVAIKADDNAEIDYTTLANNPALRDIVATLSMVVNMTSPPPTGLSQVSGTPGDPNQPPGATTADQQANFYQVFNDLTNKMQTAAANLDPVNTKLGYAQSSLQTIQDNHTLDENVLQTNISDAEDVDLNDVAVKLTTLQTQLQASYQITASLQKFSLAYFLGG